MFSTWSDLSYNKAWAITGSVLKSMLGKDPMGWDPGPFALTEKDVVLDMLKKAGCRDAKGTVVTNIGETDSAKMAAYGFIHGLPLALLIQKENPRMLATILQTLENNLKAGLGEHPLKTPQKALIFEATK